MSLYQILNLFPRWPLVFLSFLLPPLVARDVVTCLGTAGKSCRGGNCPLFRLFTFSISLSMIRFSAIINLWGEGNKTSRSDDFMYFKESTVRKPLLSNSPARRSSSSPLEIEQSHWYTSLFGVAIMARKSGKWLKDEQSQITYQRDSCQNLSGLNISFLGKKIKKPRLNSIFLHCNNEATKVFENIFDVSTKYLYEKNNK